MKKQLHILLLFLTLSITTFAQIANQPNDLNVCDADNDGYSQFDLTYLDAEILDSQDPVDYTVTYHETQADAENGTNALASPYNNIVSNIQTVFIRVEENSSGNADTTTVNLIVNPAPTSTQPTPLEVCDLDNSGDEQQAFDLTIKNSEILNGQTNVSLAYYLSENDALSNSNIISNPTQFTNIVSPQTIYARVTNSNTGCFSVVNFDVVVNLLPSIVSPTALILCDFNNPGDGKEIFILEDVHAKILNGQTGITLTHYETQVDAENNVNPISSPYTNSTPYIQTIYVRATDDITGCFAVVNFDIVVDPLPSIVSPTPLVACDEDGDGYASFNLFLKDDEIINGQTNVVVTYHETLSDAENGLNALNSTYMNSVQSVQTIYATLANLNGCGSATQSFDLVVDPTCMPCQAITASIDSTVPEINASGFVVTQPNEEVSFTGSATFSDDATDANYNWDFGDGNTATGTNVTNTYNELGNYTVTLSVQDTNPIGCMESTTISVIVVEPFVSINNEVHQESYYSPEELVTNILVANGCYPVSIFSSQTNGNPDDIDTKNYGYFNAENATNFPFEEGIVLTTGVASLGGNTLNNTLVSNNNAQAGDVDLETALNLTNTNDAAFIKFNFVPISDEFSFRYLMASEEYDGTTECIFSDGFAFLLREVGATEYINLAVLPDGSPVNVTNINNSNTCPSNSEFFEGYNIGNTNYGGRTTVLTASATVVPGATYEIKLVVADKGDSIWDSAIFIEAGSFNLGENPCEEIGFIDVKAFNDTNSNAIFDSDESFFTNGFFTYEKNDDGIINNVNTSTGNFSILSTDENDEYSISFNVYDIYEDCYTTTVTTIDAITVASENVVNVDFPVTDTQVCEDVAVYLVNPFASPRPGFDLTNQIVLENLSSFPVSSGTIEFTLDDALNINNVFNLNPNYTMTTTATGFTIDFVNLEAGTSEIIEVDMNCPTSVELGELLTNSVSYTTISNDVFVENNSSQLSETVIGAYDPNDKMEAHGPQILYDDFVTSDEYLFYTIRFQNVGTAEAINVRIEDVLDSQLDESTFQMLRSSHDYVVTRTANSLEWNLENINLPAEQDDSEGSNGYVYFKIKPNAGYAVGDIIENSAAIYFDFNDPIITNTFQTEFVETLSVGDFENSSFRLFPNPAKDEVTIQLANSNFGTTKVDIYNIQGKVVLKDMKLETNTSTIDISNLESGFYFVELTIGKRSTIQKLMVK
ncbi:DUF7619 domain-containing protein [Winogradskyella forsetii]|uniref:DUF7619 domain-containing protein n=1 Tax=Winogradskyella forsetii TaxID=2686077 RepID=UPI0015B91A4E|nr:choice-of-anchor L domain-containing protein [Winogradskyella forsetii]